jgi:hypothetical protein
VCDLRWSASRSCRITHGERFTCTHWICLLLPRWNRTSCPVDTILFPRMLVVITFVSDERLAWLTQARGAEWIGRQWETASSVIPVIRGTSFLHQGNHLLLTVPWELCFDYEVVAVVWQTWVCYRLFDTSGTCIDNVLIISWLNIFFIVWNVEVKVFYVSFLFQRLVIVLTISNSEIICTYYSFLLLNEYACL